MKSDPELTLLDRAKELAQRAQDHGVDVAIVLLLSAVEVAASAIIARSSERKLKRSLCKLTTKKRINRALAILRREGYVSQREYAELRRVLRILRYMRNALLHPVCVEKYMEIDLGTAIRAVQRFLALAESYIIKNGGPSAAADSAIR